MKLVRVTAGGAHEHYGRKAIHQELCRLAERWSRLGERVAKDGKQLVEIVEMGIRF